MNFGFCESYDEHLTNFELGTRLTCLMLRPKEIGDVDVDTCTKGSNGFMEKMIVSISCFPFVLSHEKVSAIIQT